MRFKVFRLHLNSKNGFLLASFMESNLDQICYLNLAPLLQHVGQKRLIVQKYLHAPPDKWPQTVKILRHIIKPELVTP